MEYLRNATLRKAFLIITAISLIIGCSLAALSFLGLEQFYQSKMNYLVNIQISSEDDFVISSEPVSSDQYFFGAMHVFSALEIVLPILCVIISVIVADVAFYQIKLKKPLKELKNCADKIKSEDLDFEVDVVSTDEFGELCMTFEKMRSTIKNMFEKLLEEKEENKQLNAAFAHDLKNPLTIIKGELSLLEIARENEMLNKKMLVESTDVIRNNLQRIEENIDAMNKAVKMELLCFMPEKVNYNDLCNKIKAHCLLLLNDSNVKIKFQFEESEREEIRVEYNMLHRIIENVVLNSARYAQKIYVKVYLEGVCLNIVVQDNGPGFSSDVLNNGIHPFIRGTHNNDNHFGMGLYICKVLCQKHNGDFIIMNSDEGALCHIRLEIM